MKQVVLPTDIEPGDVHWSAVDGKPHWVDQVAIRRFHLPPERSMFSSGTDEQIVVLICEGERRIEVHHLDLPVLVGRGN